MCVDGVNIEQFDIINSTNPLDAGDITSAVAVSATVVGIIQYTVIMYIHVHALR